MEFVIKKQKPSPKCGYYIEVEFMHGDADDYSQSVSGPVQEDGLKEIEDIINLIEQVFTVSNKYEGKVIRGEDLSRIDPNLRKYIDGYCDDSHKLHVEWPSDHCYGGIGAWLDGYRVYYIDSYGKEFEVEIKR